MPKPSRALAASFIISRSESDPITIETSGAFITTFRKKFQGFPGGYLEKVKALGSHELRESTRTRTRTTKSFLRGPLRTAMCFEIVLFLANCSCHISGRGVGFSP